MISQEAILHQQVCDYLRLQYPDVLFRTDFAAGIKMTMGQATKHKRLQSVRAWPDIFIAQPQYYDSTHTQGEEQHGLFIELKAKNIYKKDGSLLANDHIAEQAKVLDRLTSLGYAAYFAVGFDEARKIIDDYLSR